MLKLTPMQTSHLVLLGMLATLPAAPGCGGQSTDVASTDTGNPPIIDAQSITLSATDAGVSISGRAGAVSSGAKVEVTNTSSGAKKNTSAKDDGSFDLAIGGSAEDEYRVVVEQNGQETQITLKRTSSSAGLDLSGKDYLLQMATGYEPVADTTIRLSFGDDANFGFSGGCNSYGADYTICETDKLCVEGFSWTVKGCQQELHMQDTWLADFLTNEPTLTQEGSRLTLTGADATLEFLDEEVADPDRPLVGPTWTVDTFIMGDAASNFGLENEPTIVFNDDSTLTVNTGCNSGGGDYEVQGNNLVLSGAAVTERACIDEGAARAEAALLEVLAPGTASFEIDRNRLTVTQGEVGIMATAK